MVSSLHAVPKEPLPSKIFWVGIGCKQGTPKSLIEQAIRSVFEAYALREGAIAGLATIDTKVQEAGLIAFCRDRFLPLRFYAAERLQSVVVPNPSSAIETAVGTPSVAEAAALLACWEVPCGEAKEREEGQITAAVQGRRELTSTLLSTPILHVPKQCYRSVELTGVVTIAVARPS